MQAKNPSTQYQVTSVGIPDKHNRYPDCLFLDLVVETVQPSGQWLSSQERQGIEAFILYLTLNFNEQWHNLKFGRVKIGLKGGELRLKLKNAKIPYNARELAQDLELSVKKSVSITQGRESQGSGSGSWSSSDGPAVGMTVGGKRNFEKTETAEVMTCQVSTKGSVVEPVWDFRLRTIDDVVLIGRLNGEKLATLQDVTAPCDLEATFQVSIRDVWITEGEGIWPSDISFNKLAWIKREIVLWFLEHKIKPYLSRILLRVLPEISTQNGVTP